jgi:hypothetical protein
LIPRGISLKQQNSVALKNQDIFKEVLNEIHLTSPYLTLTACLARCSQP